MFYYPTRKYPIMLFVFALFLFACKGEKGPLTPDYDIPPGKEIYIPADLKSNDFTQKSSQWCYQRMAYSDNIVVFWEKGFGDDPTLTDDVSMRFNIKTLLTKAETMYSFYSDSLRFIEKGKSQADKYRMMIMLFYTSDWMAFGAGYDNVIGALWVSPSTMKPVGAVIAHELGHSFQYMVNCDGKYGFRDQNYVGMFWEQCAQWMALQLYPTSLMGNLSNFVNKTHLHFLDEELRYESVYLIEYWNLKHGRDILGKVWRGAQPADDPIEAYKRVTGIDQEQFNNQVFEYACRNISWDYPVGYHMNQYGPPKHKTPLIVVGNAWKPGTATSDYSPESYGYNAIQLNVPAQGTNVEADLTPLTDNAIAGWRWGFVGVKTDGKAKYGNMSSGNQGRASFIVNTGLKELWLVVSGAPTVHQRHPWVSPVHSDIKFPYQVSFINTQPKTTK
jgi:hypothetical protein